MILVLNSGVTAGQRDKLVDAILTRGGEFQDLMLSDRQAIVITKPTSQKLDYLAIDGVERAISTKNELKRTSWDAQAAPTRVTVGGATFGPGQFLIIAGPCAVESDEQYLRIAHAAKRAGAHALRGGAFKPRTSPYSFQGMGKTGLEILARARAETGLPVVTEALDVRDLEMVCELSDVIQVGSRNMQNFPLLKEVGRAHKPVLLKRGLTSTIQEWLLAAEYVMEGGNAQVILCERGIRSFDTETRNFLDLAAVPVVKAKSHLPVIVDPSHGLGRRDLIAPMTLASLAAGSHGAMIEIHDQPETALSDGFQALRPNQLEKLIEQLKVVGKAFDVTVP